MALVNQGESADRVANFTIDDAHEVHVGAEYILPVARHPGIRAGFWFDPDHSVHFTPTAANDFLDERIAAMLSSGKDLWHYTVGGMLAVHPKVDLSARGRSLVAIDAAVAVDHRALLIDGAPAAPSASAGLQPSTSLMSGSAGSVARLLQHRPARGAALLRFVHRHGEVRVRRIRHESGAGQAHLLRELLTAGIGPLHLDDLLHQRGAL